MYVYCKALHKVNKSERSGAGTDEIYKPSLWYFKLLFLLNDQETPRETISNIEDNDSFIS
ncbi:hypothetical protein NQ314_002173 [Rhamnusium bicolor]|uniref:Uncharacterized protein n=1 Tax=Rhamnusium bicolor TaxID=1586634 RepID=A0AAV8ZR21_9CUCU|nr:hypothetical protein NQ314_002173 [Rhamnusium bicolor]